MNHPKISIITPSYNQGKFIKQTIDSVLGQNYPNLEYWVIDGGSTDNTIDILKSYGDKIQWISEPDKGQANAINKGFKKVSGEIVAFINSDDYYFPYTLNKVGEVFTNPEVKWAAGDYTIINEENKEIHSLIRSYKNLLRLFNSWQLLSVVNYINQPSCFWRKEIVDKYGYINEELNFAIDYDYWMRMAREVPLTIIKEKLSVFRIHNHSKGGTEFVKQFNEEEIPLEVYNYPKISRILHHMHNQLIIGVYKMIK
jgi:glycosyltransferase involved in cell wall biosynthesis